MHWYDDLTHYFPRAEMRVREHFQWLIDHRPDIYRVQAANDHVLLYLDYEDRVFIDYLYVYPGCRAQGVGTRVMDGLKHKGKAILLEAEPASPDDPDSIRRRRFYDRGEFRTVTSLAFRLPSLLTWTFTDLDVLCWAPFPVDEDRLFQWMETMYQDLYAGIDPAIYGKPYPPVSQCLRGLLPGHLAERTQK